MLTFYHAPWSRSFAAFWLLEELGADYRMEVIDIRGEGGAPESYRAIQPSKKVPAIEHDGTIITERAAIFTYLADIFGEASLAPATGDADRGPYLTSLVYHDAVFDPVICAMVKGVEYVSNEFPFGTFEDMLNYLQQLFSKRPFAAGERFTAADILWGTGIDYTMNTIKALPESAVLQDYVARVTERPTYKRCMDRDAAMATQYPFFQKMMATGKA